MSLGLGPECRGSNDAAAAGDLCFLLSDFDGYDEIRGRGRRKRGKTNDDHGVDDGDDGDDS